MLWSSAQDVRRRRLSPRVFSKAVGCPERVEQKEGMQREQSLWRACSGEGVEDIEEWRTSEQRGGGSYGCKNQAWGQRFGVGAAVRDGLIGIKVRIQEETGKKSEEGSSGTESTEEKVRRKSVFWEDGVSDYWSWDEVSDY